MLDVKLADEVGRDFGDQAAIGFEAKTLGKAPPPSATRDAAFMLAAGTLIAQCAQLAAQVWQSRQSRDAVLHALAQHSDKSYDLKMLVADSERRIGYIAWLLDKILPENLFPSPLERQSEKRSKEDWLAEVWRDRATEGTKAANAVQVHKFADFPFHATTSIFTWAPEPGCDERIPSVTDVPARFVTDFASVPRCFWWALPPYREYADAALIHDWLYWSQHTSRQISDLAFDEALREFKVAEPIRQLMWASVRIFGGKHWRAADEEYSRGGFRVLKSLPTAREMTWSEWRNSRDVKAVRQRLVPA